MIATVFACVLLAMSLACVAAILFSGGETSAGVERPPYPSNPAERAGQPISPAVARLDRNIRTWLDRDDIEAWILVAREAGLRVQDQPVARSVPLVNPVCQHNEE